MRRSALALGVLLLAAGLLPAHAREVPRVTTKLAHVTFEVEDEAWVELDCVTTYSSRLGAAFEAMFVDDSYTMGMGLGPSSTDYYVTTEIAGRKNDLYRRPSSDEGKGQHTSETGWRVSDSTVTLAYAAWGDADTVCRAFVDGEEQPFPGHGGTGMLLYPEDYEGGAALQSPNLSASVWRQRQVVASGGLQLGYIRVGEAKSPSAPIGRSGFKREEPGGWTFSIQNSVRTACGDCQAVVFLDLPAA